MRQEYLLIPSNAVLSMSTAPPVGLVIRPNKPFPNPLKNPSAPSSYIPATNCTFRMIPLSTTKGNGRGYQTSFFPFLHTEYSLDVHYQGRAELGFPWGGGGGGGTNFPGGGGGAPTYDFAKFSRKLHEIERIWMPRGPSRPP